MSMFAASLNTLKQRTSQLIDSLDKNKDGRGVGDAEDFGSPSAVRDIQFGPQVAAALGLSDDSLLVQYEVQGDKDREPAVFILQLGGAVSVTAAMVRSSFPPPGRYHFRFKAPTSDGSFGGWVWIDLASEDDFVPIFNGGISMKALRIPPEAGGYQAPARAVPSQAAPAGPASDLMAFDLGGSSVASSPAASASPSPPQPVQLDRAKLVAERERRMQQEYEEKMARHEEAKRREEQSKKEKVELNNNLSRVMNDWAKTPDGQSFKEIRTLLSTMHTVMWENSGWQPLSLSELVADSNIKKYYRKAILMAHPDRHQSAASEQQVRADRIFNALNESFKAFNK
eukprot:TRINITY_DN36113_c0_g1_i1.p1 TRINITY_DN36113_c0_g1~~TRINITY_DN36113_c0_g1_i1.p1  ORF type:complete len:356 (+),score=85.76 TRINITY_DN36113_c0_g1_i1:47-1069(+)